MNPELYLLLIGELEGCSQHLTKLGQTGDKEVIREMISKYWKLYRKCLKANEVQADN